MGVKKFDWAKAFEDQKQWMAERGGDRDGYRAFYCGQHDRTVGEADAIYYADKAEFDRIAGRQPYGVFAAEYRRGAWCKEQA